MPEVAAAITPPNTAIPMAAKKTVRKAKPHEPAPTFTHDVAPQAAAIIVQAWATGNVLWCKRGTDGDHPGEWAFPGGKIEKNEPPMVAALRELREETGFINEEEEEPDHVASLNTGDVELAVYKLMVNNEFIPTLDAENTAWAWAPLDNPPQPVHTGIKDKGIIGDKAVSFKEQEHPRDDDGKFTEGGGGGQGSFLDDLDEKENEEAGNEFNKAVQEFITKQHAMSPAGKAEKARQAERQKQIKRIRNDLERWKGPDPSQDEHQAIDYYTGSGYDQINAEYRSGDETSYEGHFLKKYLDKCSLRENAILYRGIKGNYAKKIAQLPVGSVFRDKGFVSTTADPELEFLTLGDTRLRIRAKKGAKGASVAHMSDSGSEEAEVLFQAGTHFKIMGRSAGFIDVEMLLSNEIEEGKPVHDKAILSKADVGDAINHVRLTGTSKDEILREQRAAKDAAFKESEHPRDNDGKFTEGGGSLTGGEKQAPADIKQGTHTFDMFSELPEELNGVKFTTFEPPEDWNEVYGVNHILAEEEKYKPLKGKPTQTYEWQGKEYRTAEKKPASGVMITEPDGRVWIMKPMNQFGGYKNTWPKGKVDEGLSPQANAIKEAWEETGLHVRITGIVGDFEGDTSIARIYKAERIGGNPQHAGWETEGVVLAKPEDVHGLLNRSRDRKIAAAGGIKAPEKPKESWKPQHVAKAQEKAKPAPEAPKEAGGVIPEKHLGWAPSSIHKAEKAGAPTWNVYKPSKEELEAAPAPTTQKPLKMSELTKTGGQLGSNPGGRYKDKEGNEYYIKKSKSPAHAKNELLAGALFKLAGAGTLDYVPTDDPSSVATRWQKLDKTNAKDFTPEERKKAQEDFAVHAWTANWDAAGLDFDNQSTKDGKIVSNDLGGALTYRAQGAPKGDKFGNTVGEWETLRDKNLNPSNGQLFGGMSSEQLKKSAERVTTISDAAIRKAVKDNGLGDDLANKLIARKKDIAKKAGVQAADAGFNEGDHPRDNDGKFTEGSGSSGSKEQYKPVWTKNKRKNAEEARKIVESLGFKTVEYDNPKSSGAAYFSNGAIYINSANKFWSDPIGGMERQTNLSSKHPEHVIHHEIGHALYSPPDNFFSLKDQDLARNEVSKYAAMNPKEFVSEIHAGMQAGNKYSEAVMSAFSRYARKRQAADAKLDHGKTKPEIAMPASPEHVARITQAVHAAAKKFGFPLNKVKIVNKDVKHDIPSMFDPKGTHSEYKFDADTIMFYPPGLENDTPEYIEPIFKHELMHHKFEKFLQQHGKDYVKKLVGDTDWEDAADVSRYSSQMFQRYQAGDIPFEAALHETLADMAKYDIPRTGSAAVDKLYRMVNENKDEDEDDSEDEQMKKHGSFVGDAEKRMFTKEHLRMAEELVRKAEEAYTKSPEGFQRQARRKELEKEKRWLEQVQKNQAQDSDYEEVEHNGRLPRQEARTFGSLIGPVRTPNQGSFKGSVENLHKGSFAGDERVFAMDRKLVPVFRARRNHSLRFGELALDKSMRNYDVDGRLHIKLANISKATVNPYVGNEIPDYKLLGLEPNKIYYLYRDPEELKRAVGTFNGLPLLSKHEPVTAQSHDPKLVVGSTGTDGRFDGTYLQNSLVVWPQADIKKIEKNDKRQISCGYRYYADMTPGVSPEGERYDGVMRDIVGNHVALVEEGRAGKDVAVPS